VRNDRDAGHEAGGYAAAGVTEGEKSHGAAGRAAAVRAAFAVLTEVRTAINHVSYRLGAPQSIEDVDRADPRVMFRWLRAQLDAAGRGPPGTSYEVWRPQYVWGILTAAWMARALKIRAIAVMEFGVAGGNGLLAMEAAASEIENLVGVEISVYGFDMGHGMPKPVDHRDAPFAVREGYFPMEPEQLKARLRRAELVLGPVEDTVSEFLRAEHAPIGFVSFDLDYYSSTMQAFGVLGAGSEHLLPRVLCNFQGILWHPWTEFNGARAAINDFNAAHEWRKISPIYGLKYSLPRSEFRRPWTEMMFVTEIFDHERYGSPLDIRPLDQRLLRG
jgi:hypothetical protein